MEDMYWLPRVLAVDAEQLEEVMARKFVKQDEENMVLFTFEFANLTVLTWFQLTNSSGLVHLRLHQFFIMILSYPSTAFSGFPGYRLYANIFWLTMFLLVV